MGLDVPETADELHQALSTIKQQEQERGQGIVEFVAEEGIKAATIMVATVRILLLYPWLQRYFIRGVMIGAIKG